MSEPTDTTLEKHIVLDAGMRKLLDDTVQLLKIESASSSIDLERKETLMNFLLQWTKLYDIEFPKFVGFQRITVSATPPVDPQQNDLWVDIS